MLIQNPSFLSRQPAKLTQMAILLALLWATLPLGMYLPSGIMLLFCVLLAARFVLVHFHTGKIARPVILLLLLASTLLVWKQLGGVVGRSGGIAFLLLMVVLKTYEGNTLRDWQVLLLAMLFLIGCSVLLDQGMLTGLWVLSSLLAVVWCFSLLGGLSVRQGLRQGVQALLLTMPLMAVLFVAVPRKSEPLWRIPQQKNGQAKTGLSNTMRPGSISQLVQSDEQVANITFTGQAPSKRQMYWRAVVMAEFDGESWQAVPEQVVDTTPATPQGLQTAEYQIIVQDQGGALPALDYPIGALPTGTSQRLGDVVRAERSREGLRRLTMRASLGDTLAQPLSDELINFYTRLPAGNPRTRELVQQLAKGQRNSRQLIDSVLAYYRKNGFTYTLMPPLTEGRNGIDRFMFETRQGFCEHYAQSFVVMMRAVGLPARVVTGYLGGDYFTDGNFWQLRSKDAHAWAEVWLPEEQKWLRVDPTAAVSAQRASSGIREALPAAQQTAFQSEDSSWHQWSQTGQYYWQQWVVNYDQTRQNHFFAQLGLGGFNVMSFLTVLLAGGGLAVLPVGWWWRRSRRRDIRPLEEGLYAIKEVLLGGEDPKAAGMTPAELAALMRSNGVDDQRLLDLLAQYQHWRYAADQPPGLVEQHLWLSNVRKALRPYRQSKR